MGEGGSSDPPPPSTSSPPHPLRLGHRAVPGLCSQGGTINSGSGPGEGLGGDALWHGAVPAIGGLGGGILIRERGVWGETWGRVPNAGTWGGSSGVETDAEQ